MELQTSWIPKNPPHDGTDRWWCPSCNVITPLEFNPDWIADGKPFKWKGKEYSWFVRCKKCGKIHYQRTWYECPKCGWNGYPDDPDVRYAVSRGRVVIFSRHWKAGKKEVYPIIKNFSSYSDMNGSGVQWDEIQCCPKHGPFTFTNGS